MKKTIYNTFLLVGFILGLYSCSNNEITPEPQPPFSLDASKISGEWISKSAAKYNKMSMLASGEFDEMEVTRGWAVASANEKGTWTANTANNTILGTYIKKNGAEDTNGENISVTLETTSQSDYSFVAKTNGNETVYRRLLGEVKLRKGQTVIPECMPEKQHTETKKIVTPFNTKYETITTEIIKNLVSENTTVATVDPSTGAITAVENGMTFVNVETADKGTGTIKVIIDDDFSGLLGKTREEIYDIYGTNNIITDNIQYTKYNLGGDLYSISMEYRKGVVNSAKIYLQKNVDITPYKDYISNNYNLYEEKENYYRYIDNATFKTSSTIAIVDYTKGENTTSRYMRYIRPNTKTYNIILDDYSIALDKSKDELLKIYGKPYGIHPQSLMYVMPEGFNTHVNYVVFFLNDNGICWIPMIYLQANVDKEEIHNFLSKEMTFIGYIPDTPETFVYKYKDNPNIEVQYDKKMNVVTYWYPPTASTKASNFITSE